LAAFTLFFSLDMGNHLPYYQHNKLIIFAFFIQRLQKRQPQSRHHLAISDGRFRFIIHHYLFHGPQNDKTLIIKHFKLTLPMKLLLSFCFLLGVAHSYAQNLPADNQVIKDVKQYHGKLQTAQLNGAWQLVRESGYTFSNTAKHPVAAITQKNAGGIQTKIQGLAIYVRGSANGVWRFSRYFAYENSAEVIGAKAPGKDELLSIVKDAMINNPRSIFNEHSYICWMYSMVIPEPSAFQQKSENEMTFNAEFDYEIKRHGLVEHTKQIRELNCKKQNNKWTVHYSDDGRLTAVSQQSVDQSILEQTPGIGEKPFDELYGPQGPTFASQNTGGKVSNKLKGILKKN
jgi:hypothetical protein